MPSLNTGNAILSNAITVDGSYNVGIGISSPNCKLEVLPTTNNKIQFGTGVVGSSGEYVGGLYYTSNKLSLQSFLVGTGYQPVLIAPDGGNVGIGTSSPSEQLNLMGANAYTSKIRFSYGASSTGYYTNFGYNSDGNKAYLQIADGGSPATIMTWNYNGNVGIGTSSPSTILHVVDTSANDTTLTLGTTNEIPTIKAGGSNTDLRLEAIGSGGNLYFTTNGNLRTTITSGGALALGTSNSNGFTFRISSNANNNSDAKKVMQLGNDVVNSVSAYMYIGSYAGIDWLVGKDTSGAGDYRFNLSLYTGEQRMVLYTNGNYSFAGSNVSDIRLKSNINTLDVNALDKITHFVPKSYYMTDNPEQIRYGFIAQEIGELVPDLVTGEEKEQEYLGLDYNGVLTLAVKAIQELNQKVEAQQQQINQLINK